MLFVIRKKKLQFVPFFSTINAHKLWNKRLYAWRHHFHCCYCLDSIVARFCTVSAFTKLVPWTIVFIYEMGKQYQIGKSHHLILVIIDCRLYSSCFQATSTKLNRWKCVCVCVCGFVVTIVQSLWESVLSCYVFNSRFAFIFVLK